MDLRIYFSELFAGKPAAERTVAEFDAAILEIERREAEARAVVDVAATRNADLLASQLFDEVEPTAATRKAAALELAQAHEEVQRLGAALTQLRKQRATRAKRDVAERAEADRASTVDLAASFVVALEAIEGSVRGPKPGLPFGEAYRVADEIRLRLYRRLTEVQRARCESILKDEGFNFAIAGLLFIASEGRLCGRGESIFMTAQRPSPSQEGRRLGTNIEAMTASGWLDRVLPATEPEAKEEA